MIPLLALARTGAGALRGVYQDEHNAFTNGETEITMSETETTAAAKPEAAPKPEKVVMPEQNGIRRPKPGTEIDKVWKTADDLSTSLQRPATRAEVRAALEGTGINPATFATQYARWTKFYGVSGDIRAARQAESAEKKAASDAAKAEKATERAAKKAEKDAGKEQRAKEREEAKAAKAAEAETKRKAAAEAKEQEKAAKAAAAAAKAAETAPAAETKAKGGRKKAAPADAPAAA